MRTSFKDMTGHSPAGEKYTLVATMEWFSLISEFNISFCAVKEIVTRLNNFLRQKLLVMNLKIWTHQTQSISSPDKRVGHIDSLLHIATLETRVNCPHWKMVINPFLGIYAHFKASLWDGWPNRAALGEFQELLPRRPGRTMSRTLRIIAALCNHNFQPHKLRRKTLLLGTIRFCSAKTGLWYIFFAHVLVGFYAYLDTCTVGFPSQFWTIVNLDWIWFDFRTSECLDFVSPTHSQFFAQVYESSFMPLDATSTYSDTWHLLVWVLGVEKRLVFLRGRPWGNNFSQSRSLFCHAPLGLGRTCPFSFIRKAAGYVAGKSRHACSSSMWSFAPTI